ncbi:uncharacterized protein LOC114752026 [Neltuma alba]|uniref:uncharacterized protein LOC114752026 n=1 Tax=Neltuma alba TaxID=207710 RepID=UPI0010A3EA8B|nr:uncharacterized protein LOC114752026 [Prosopis alba]
MGCTFSLSDNAKKDEMKRCKSSRDHAAHQLASRKTKKTQRRLHHRWQSRHVYKSGGGRMGGASGGARDGDIILMMGAAVYVQMDSGLGIFHAGGACGSGGACGGGGGILIYKLFFFWKIILCTQGPKFHVLGIQFEASGHKSPGGEIAFASPALVLTKPKLLLTRNPAVLPARTCQRSRWSEKLDVGARNRLGAGEEIERERTGEDLIIGQRLQRRLGFIVYIGAQTWRQFTSNPTFNSLHKAMGCGFSVGDGKTKEGRTEAQAARKTKKQAQRPRAHRRRQPRYGYQTGSDGGMIFMTGAAASGMYGGGGGCGGGGGLWWRRWLRWRRRLRGRWMLMRTWIITSGPLN